MTKAEVMQLDKEQIVDRLFALYHEWQGEKKNLTDEVARLKSYSDELEKRCLMLEENNAALSKSVLTPHGQRLLCALVKMYWVPDRKRCAWPLWHQLKYSSDFLLLAGKGCPYMEEDEFNIEMQNLADGGYIQIDEKDVERTWYSFKVRRPLLINVGHRDGEEEDCR